jgi:hypothetical protein
MIDGTEGLVLASQRLFRRIVRARNLEGAHRPADQVGSRVDGREAAFSQAVLDLVVHAETGSCRDVLGVDPVGAGRRGDRPDLDGVAHRRDGLVEGRVTIGRPE